MRLSEALEMHREEVRAIIARYPVSNPRIFGSVARGEDIEGSDVDILVEPRVGCTTFVDLGLLKDELANLLGAGVDIVTPAGMRKEVSERLAAESRDL